MPAMTATARPTGTSFVTKLGMFQPDKATLPAPRTPPARLSWLNLCFAGIGFDVFSRFSHIFGPGLNSRFRCLEFTNRMGLI